MAAPAIPLDFDPKRPIDLNSKAFHGNKDAWYRWMLEEAPVCNGKVSVVKVKLVSRYDDCKMVLSDDRFMRNRGRARGKGSGSMPFPVPKAVKALAQSMILEDDPEHRRLRNLVNKAFTPRAVGALADRVEDLSQELVDELEDRSGPIDLLEDYARPVPTLIISEMMGIAPNEVGRFQIMMKVLSGGLQGMAMLRTLLWDLRQVRRFIAELVERKRSSPGEDILSNLIHAEEEGDRLSEDELLAMVFLLIIGGFETTMHLITNSVRTLVEHPDELERLLDEPKLWGSAVEELVRHSGPIHGTKLQYTAEDVTLHGETLARGTAVMPMLAAANRDPRVFEEPDAFDITRSPNHHLGFGFGAHFCLGRQLALMETRVALKNLFETCPGLRLAVAPSKLELAPMVGWHRHKALPVLLS